MKKMTNIDELFTQAQEKVEQMKRQKILQDNREKKKQEAITMRRNILIGELITKYFPEVLKFQPRRTQAENSIEFELLELFVSMLADDKDYIERLKQQTATRKLLDNQ